jgi:histone acetyltransferase (RNA polymerase elongator complex component)
MIIPFFINHQGCPHQCVFCNQKNITGQEPVPPASVPSVIEDFLRRSRDASPAELAFYGGTFTALPIELQREYLDAVQQFIRDNRVQSIRLSTRPDCISEEILSLLKEKHVSLVELGAQSMNDKVLALAGRGHTAAHTRTAMGLLKTGGFRTGLQLMPGVPGDTTESFRETVQEAIRLMPDVVRIYPLLVIKGTPLEKTFLRGEFAPQTLDEAVAACSEATIAFDEAGIEVIRTGLQSSDELEKPGTILAGPYHPAFGELVAAAVLLERMRAALRARALASHEAVIRIHPRDLSAAIGASRSSVAALKREFGLNHVRFVKDEGVKKRGMAILENR